jgi:2-oxoglutarate dehydrogenase E2 component (dihydrolipoamide succinyltransferase)
MKVTLKLARISMTTQSATITEWFKKPGDAFAKDEPLYAIETEKAVQDMTAPNGGVMLEILADRGAEVEVGAPVCVVNMTL